MKTVFGALAPFDVKIVCVLCQIVNLQFLNGYSFIENSLFFMLQYAFFESSILPIHRPFPFPAIVPEDSKMI